MSDLTPLSQVTTSIQYGYTASSSTKANGPKLLRITDIQKGAVDWDTVPRCVIEDNIRSRFLLKDGDILFARSGATVGKSFLICGDNHDAVFASYLIRVRFDQAKVDPRYAYLFFASKDYWDQVNEGAAGTGQPNFNGTKLAALRIPVPSLAEQCRIVARIEALFASTRRARTDLERIAPLASACMKAAISAGLKGELSAEWRRDHPNELWTRPELRALEQNRTKYLNNRRGVRLASLPPFRSPGADSNLPSTWAQGCIADVATLRLGYAFKSEWFSGSGPKLLRGANIAPGQLEWGDEKRLSPARAVEFDAYQLRAGDIVIAMDRPLISTGIKIAKVPVEDDGAMLVQRVASPKISGMLDANFLWYVLQGPAFLDQIERRSTGSDLPHISGNDIQDTMLPLPPLREQREIAARLDRTAAHLSPSRERGLRTNLLLDRLEQSILTRAFRGELVPQNLTEDLQTPTPEVEPVASATPRRGPRAAA